MSPPKVLLALAVLGVSAALLTGASAQVPSGGDRPAATLSPAAKLPRGDRRMLRDIAQANFAELAAARLALQKSRNAEIRTFAQTMVDDHSAALEDLKHLARAKSATLPDEPDLKHRSWMKTMQALEGEQFDKQYLAGAGVSDHRKTRELLQKAQADAKDPDLKALAREMLPVVERHLAHAEQMALR
ncbi:DUF4142 domain-containing protein [Variovorax paradoxus]|nr:DUF4142 domain-containing protein [Variovorax paradoxus]